MDRYGVSTVMNPKDLNEERFRQCIEFSLNAISRKGAIREDTFIINTSNHLFGIPGSPTQSTSRKYENFKPTDCFDDHDNTNDYALESPHYHLHVSVEVGT